jgi:hypothetical protein
VRFSAPSIHLTAAPTGTKLRGNLQEPNALPTRRLEMIATDTRTELAAREGGGIRVRLLWSSSDDSVAVHVRHLGTDRTFELAVEPDRALDAYYHPFAYTPRRGRRVLQAVA